VSFMGFRSVGRAICNDEDAAFIWKQKGGGGKKGEREKVGLVFSPFADGEGERESR